MRTRPATSPNPDLTSRSASSRACKWEATCSRKARPSGVSATRRVERSSKRTTKALFQSEHPPTCGGLRHSKVACGLGETALCGNSTKDSKREKLVHHLFQNGMSESYLDQLPVCNGARILSSCEPESLYTDFWAYFQLLAAPGACGSSSRQGRGGRPTSALAGRRQCERGSGRGGRCARWSIPLRIGRTAWSLRWGRPTGRAYLSGRPVDGVAGASAGLILLLPLVSSPRVKLFFRSFHGANALSELGGAARATRQTMTLAPSPTFE
jgi:hypothetical protein